MAGVGGFALVQGHHELAVGPCPNPAENVIHGGQAGRAEQLIALEHLQVMDGLFQSGVQLRNGVVNVGLDRQEFGGSGLMSAG